MGLLVEGRFGTMGLCMANDRGDLMDFLMEVGQGSNLKVVELVVVVGWRGSTAGEDEHGRWTIEEVGGTCHINKASYKMLVHHTPKKGW
ncbi:hypothetical protein KY290_033688 [Solanum tuberosum]|uniref:Uncharacterized protein n=1 Tax=Solanum tuberosum TaxID=4113 RepID=A0ABQ7U4N9_SOLTU|nr:hypothetical protein KY289_033056 [Solanum tuberosum]KAH0644684.1 hypothetical protein KY284_032568 [Solanum tuberosum]KAH0647699.1 hypothetical protein KY285_032947 [Solanum tuberosum]KAH0740645.1 hypothetical protein KY290_033688 [Solanum tuberosum]